MFLILEGCDGAGKTTLARQLQEHYPGVPVIHHGPYPGYSGNELSATFMASFKATLGGQALILDRCWLSEPIYADVYRGEPSRVMPAHQRMLERAALKAKAVVILCQPPYEACRQAFSSGREEMMESEDQLRGVWLRYGELKTSLPVVTYDHTTEDLPDLLGKLANVGYPEPRVVLLGDRPSVRAHHQAAFSVPFVSFNGVGCSGWLAEQLDAAEIPERELTWLNAFNADGTQLPAAQLTTRLPIIALGRQASSWCQELGLAHSLVPHPQSHKRFFFGKPYPLIQELQRVLND